MAKRNYHQLADGTIEIELTQNLTTIIDDTDKDLANINWCAAKVGPDKSGMYFVAINGKSPMHRIILARILNRELLRGECVDHIDGNPLNNKRSNLRLATQQQNCMNQSVPTTNKSGFKGVSWYKNAQKWRACIHLNRKTIHLGLFTTPEEAYGAYCEAAKLYFGEFARLK